MANDEQHIDDRLPAEIDEIVSEGLDCGLAAAFEADDESSQAGFPSEAQVGEKVGPYTIREKIGEGGMGVVYVAEQTEPVQRKVALKIIKAGMDTKEVIARFEAERQVLAFMEHPNIARILDAGSTKAGRSYFVMELVRGIAITEFCDQVKATPRERLKLFMTVCDAVQHAHQKGVIHRDIKPSNVLVTQTSGKPLVKVIDFGLAKATSGQRLTDKTLYTGFMRLMGTPAYMSPEQAELSSQDVDTRSDIYSLGILLYELLTGGTPLDKAEILQQTQEELCRSIRETEAPKPSARISTLKAAERSTVGQLRKIEPNQLRQLLNGDLDRVVLKAIEKDRNRRYGSPQDLAADIDRFLHDRPVMAMPPSTRYRAQKTFLRHRVAILTVSAFITILSVATAFSTWQWGQAIVAREAAEASEDKAVLARKDAERAREAAEASFRKSDETAERLRRELYAKDMLVANHFYHSRLGPANQIQKLLAKWIPTDDEPDLREFAWRIQWSRLHSGAEQTIDEVLAASISPRGDLIVVDQYGIREQKAFHEPWGRSAQGNERIELSPCGRWAAIADANEVRLIEIDSREEIDRVSGNRVRFATGGDYVLAWRYDSKEIKNVDYQMCNLSSRTRGPLQGLEYGHSIGSISKDGRSYLFVTSDRAHVVAHLGKHPPATWRYGKTVECSTWSPDGRLVATGHSTGEIILRFANDPDSHHYLPLKTGRTSVTALAFSNDGRQLALGSLGGFVEFYDTSHLYELSKRFFQIASADRHKTASVADHVSRPTISMMEPPKRLDYRCAHFNRINSLVYSADDSKLVSRDSAGTTKLWNLSEKSQALPKLDYAEFPLIAGAGFSPEDSVEKSSGVYVRNITRLPDASYAASIRDGDQLISITDAGVTHQIDSSVDAIDAHRLLAGSPDSTVEVQVIREQSQQPTTHKLQRKIFDESRIQHTNIAFTKDGGIVVCSSGGAVHRTISGRVLRYYETISFGGAVSPDGRLLALDDTKELLLWDLKRDNDKPDKRLAAQVGKHPTPRAGEGAGTISFSPDGKYIAIGTGFRLNSITKRRSDLKVWELPDYKEIIVPTFESEHCISGVTFTPNSEFLIATDHSGKLQVWRTSSWELVKTLQGRRNAVSVSVSPDGRFIVQGGFNGFATWETDRFNKWSAMTFSDYASDLKFSRDDRTVAAPRNDGKLFLWDVETGVQLASLSLGDEMLTACDFSRDGNSLAAIGLNGDVWVREAATLEEIDRHPRTLAAIYQRGIDQKDDEQFEAAESTLLHVLRMQESIRPLDHADTTKTKAALREVRKHQVEIPRTEPAKKGVPPIPGKYLEHHLE